MSKLSFYDGEKWVEIKGAKGDTYTLTDQDKSAIARSIPVPVVEKVVEKIEVVHEQPIVKEVAVADTADDIRNKLELLPEGEKLKIEAIEDLRNELDDLKKPTKGAPGHTFAIQRGQLKLYDLSDQLDGVKSTFSLPAFWRVVLVQGSSTPGAFRPTVDFTTDANASTITFTNQIDPGTTLAAGQTIIIIYAEP